MQSAKLLLLFAAVLAFATVLTSGLPYDPDLDLLLRDREDASEFFDDESSLEKRFLYTGGEQRREVKEDYEEKCERKIISSALKKPRWCPELESWPEWQKLTANDAWNKNKKSGK